MKRFYSWRAICRYFSKEDCIRGQERRHTKPQESSKSDEFKYAPTRYGTTLTSQTSRRYGEPFDHQKISLQTGVKPYLDVKTFPTGGTRRNKEGESTRSSLRKGYSQNPRHTVPFLPKKESTPRPSRRSPSLCLGLLLGSHHWKVQRTRVPPLKKQYVLPWSLPYKHHGID